MMQLHFLFNLCCLKIAQLLRAVAVVDGNILITTALKMGNSSSKLFCAMVVTIGAAIGIVIAVFRIFMTKKPKSPKPNSTAYRRRWKATGKWLNWTGSRLRNMGS